METALVKKHVPVHRNRVNVETRCVQSVLSFMNSCGQCLALPLLPVTDSQDLKRQLY